MDDVKVYMPATNGTAFTGMMLCGPVPGFGPQGRYVTEADYMELKSLYDDAVRKFCELRKSRLASSAHSEQKP